jgi:hypothetical protein
MIGARRMEMLFFLPPDEPPRLAQLQIASPKEASPAGRPETQVLPPNPAAGLNPAVRETSEDRQQRLMDHGIVPTPAPPPPEDTRSSVEKATDELAKKSKNEDGTTKPLALRTELNFGSWWSLVNPKKTTYFNDFSYGAAVLAPVDLFGGAPGASPEAILVGFEFSSFNGGAYLVSSDIWGGKSPVFAETNVLEVGPVVASVTDIPYGENQNFSFDIRAGLTPLKWVKAVSYSDQTPDIHSDLVTHWAFNWQGVQASAGVSWGFVRLFEIGAFGGIYTSTPFQVRSRFGLKVSLLGR